MLEGALTVLRARHPDDVEILRTELYNDVPTRSRADSRPWRPLSPDSAASPYAVRDPSPEVAPFSIVERDSGELAGEALLYGIDLHNRSAHLGLAVIPAFRGRGLGLDTTKVLCRYGFVTLGLHRLQLETDADNTAMARAAERCGFSSEGLLRQATWANGYFLDQRVFGLLQEGWDED
jgi:RimJ/RimL family protein N-acetyltransferase